MKRIATHLYQRGKTEVFYCRRRIPQALRRAYPEQTREIVRCLGTTSKAEAHKRLRAALVRIDAEFEAKAQELALQRRRFAEVVRPRRLEALDDKFLQSLARYWVRQVLLTDDAVRAGGLQPDEFDTLGAQLVEQREELGHMLARGDVSRVLPALYGFMHLCGIEASLSPQDAQRAGYAFLRAVVSALDFRLERQAGKPIDTEAVAPNAPDLARVSIEVSGAAASWEKVFQTWVEYVTDRPKATVIAAQTAWRELVAHAKALPLHGRSVGARKPCTERPFSLRCRPASHSIPGPSQSPELKVDSTQWARVPAPCLAVYIRALSARARAARFVVLSAAQK